MPPDLSWLPDRHLSVAATLAHADETFARLTDVLFGYSTQPDGPLVLQDVRDGRVSRATVTAVAPLPRAISLYAADVLTTLRAAVEHTLYIEVEHANGGQLTPNEAKLIQMPAAATATRFDNWVDERRRRGAPAPLLGSPLVRRIGELQPFQRHASPKEHPLWLLAAHSNLAKHRMPAVAALRLAAIRPDDHRIDPRVVIPNPVEGPVKVGDVLAEIPLGVRVPVSLYPTVGLNRPDTDQWPVLVKELDYVASWVRTRAVPILITGDAGVAPLPAAYDIAVGHHDERAAIAAGTATSAERRYTLRLSAATTRLGLADMLKANLDASEAESVDRWLANLSDTAVLERFARFTPVQTVAHERRAREVLADLITEMRTAIRGEESDD